MTGNVGIDLRAVARLFLTDEANFRNRLKVTLEGQNGAFLRDFSDLMDGSGMITVTAPLQYWSNGEGGSHFMSVSEQESLEIRAHAFMNPRGFRSVRVECTVGDIVWRTSVFPQKSGGYFLPMKIDICRRAGLAAGDEVTVELELL